jgi:predicted CxxxxCH...CXXCH cytochrome family protein
VIRNTAIRQLGRAAAWAIALSTSGLLGAATARAQTCDPATSAVGAHLSHTRASFARSALACTECHAPVCTPAQTSNVVFGALAAAGGAQPAWNPATKTCSGVYCHGATLSRPGGPVAWAYVDPAVVRPPSQACVLCHGYPPSSPHDAAAPTDCHGCHGSVAADGSIDIAGGLHVNGTLDVSGGACGSCHAMPPATGAHVAHYGLQGGSGFSDVSTLQDRYPTATPTSAPAVYAFGCGNCHPGGRHRDGVVDVVLYDASAPAGSLKARAAPTAAYDRSTRTCNGVYCHSSGQATPAYVATPGWFSGAHLGCAGCHTNPPAYPSGGAGTVTANSHLDLAQDGYEFGHFLGMPGPTHTSKHGGNWSATDDAAPITCQSCHYETTDPSHTGPSGFYYLDTSGTYTLPGGVDPGWQATIQCGACHSAGSATAPTQGGKVLPLRHVNGVRDVVFDPRTTLPVISWLPAAPDRPVGPYWMTGASASMPYPSSVRFTGGTVSFGLGAAGYDRATKTCTNVACHLVEQPVWGTPYIYSGSVTCNACHPM